MALLPYEPQLQRKFWLEATGLVDPDVRRAEPVSDGVSELSTLCKEVHLFSLQTHRKSQMIRARGVASGGSLL